MTLDMLRQSLLNPELSYYEQGEYTHNFERTTLAPLVCNLQIHKKPHKQLTYAPQPVGGWYFLLAVHLYKLYTCYNIDTGGENTSLTIAFHPEFLKM